jgi:hypothetical protein
MTLELKWSNSVEVTENKKNIYRGRTEISKYLRHEYTS